MSAYTIVDDATGEVISLVDMPDERSVALNTPDHASVIEGWPPSAACYLLRGRWVERPPRPSRDHTWDIELKMWSDTRPDEDFAAHARGQRDILLAASDWVVSRAMEMSEPVPEPWRQYRARLREVTTQPGFPRSIDWPVTPS
ncbi:MAG: phage tail assembly chaperone [Burkholderiaceae bacterium]